MQGQVTLRGFSTSCAAIQTDLIQTNLKTQTKQ